MQRISLQLLLLECDYTYLSEIIINSSFNHFRIKCHDEFEYFYLITIFYLKFDLISTENHSQTLTFASGGHGGVTSRTEINLIEINR